MKKKILYIVGLIVILVTIASCSKIIINRQEKNKDFKMSSQYKDGKFFNSVATPMEMEIWNMSKDMLTGDEIRRPEKKLKINKLNPADFPSVDRDDFKVAWLGHSSLIFELEKQRILIDPVFSERASLTQYVGPKRFHDLPLDINKLPEFDVVLISHDHYDHLDKASIKALIAKTTYFFVPLGVDTYLKEWGVPETKIKTFDWWDKVNVGTITYICTPARHFSGRGIFDRNSTLWASWVIKGELKSAFYSGDTGPYQIFKEIGKLYGPFDVAAIQIGAYNSKYWPTIHLTPEEGYQVFKQLKAKTFLPVHWGTFNLGLHDWNEPIKKIRALAEKFDFELIEVIPGEKWEESEKEVSEAELVY